MLAEGGERFTTDDALEEILRNGLRRAARAGLCRAGDWAVAVNRLMGSHSVRLVRVS